MNESESGGADDDRRRTPDATEVTGSPSADRRRVLKTLTLPPIAAALAGCEFGLPDDDATRRTVDRDVEPGDTAGLGAVVRFGESYRMEMARRTADGAVEHLTGRFHGEDYRLRFDRDGTVIESAVVGDDVYQVVDGECVRYSGANAGIDSVRRTVEDRADAVSGEPGATVSGTASIDGREMLVVELPARELEGAATDVTYYVDSETRYLRRLETGSAVVDYRDWGEVGPIDPPDVPCSEPG